MRSSTRELHRFGRFAALRCVVACIWAVLFAAPAFAQRDLKDIPPPDPELERQTLQLADGLEINLYAADPLIAKPIQMNFDNEGRLWIATSETYPHILPGQAANDKIIVLVDADHDGRAEKTHVFAGGLLIPTGIEPGRFQGVAGAYVANSTDLIHLSDSDGDLKADRRTTLLSGFGTEDTHHLLHTLRWGPDAKLYMNQSIYIHSHIETPYGVRRLNGGGIWQFDPNTQRLEIFARGWVNAWGHAFDKWGQSFVTDGAGGEGINYAFPGSTFPTAPGAPRVLSGLNPGSPKYCGLEIIAGEHFPDDWQGDLITCDFRAHRIVRFKVSESGSGYVAREQPEVIKSSHVAFRPIDVKLGPDGALYIADWYNPIIQHGEVDFRDPRRDHTHGRIWRVTVKGRKPASMTNFAARPAIEPLMKLIKSFDPNPTFTDELFANTDPHYQAALVRTAGTLALRTPAMIELLLPFAKHEHPQVRLEAVCALRNIETPASIAGALTVLDRPMDTNLDFALWQTCREQKDVWLPDVLSEESELYDQPTHLEFALRAVDDPTIVRPLVKLLNDRKLPADRRPGVLELIARLGDPKDLAMIYRLVLEASNDDVERSLPLLSALSAAATTRQAKPAGDLSLLDVCLESHDDRVAAAAARLLGVWKVEAVRPQLLKLAEAKVPSEKSLAAVAAMADLGGIASQQALITLASDSFATATRQAAVAGLAKVSPTPAAQAAVSLLSSATPSEVDTAAIVDAFITRQNGGRELTRALEGKKLPLDTAKLAARTAASSAKPDQALVAALRTAGGITGTGLTLSPEQTVALVDEIKAKGDAPRGEALFHRKDLACLKCHAVGGAGGRVGPDLVSIGASAQVDYLVDSILQPNKAIKEGFHTLVVTTDDGLTLNGVKVRETDRDLILRNAEDKEIALPLKSIEERVQGMSLMPAGLADSLTRGELVDLVRFMSELGKVGPYQLKPAAIVRRWESLVTTPEGYELIRRNRIGIAATDNPRLTWEPAYARIDGNLRLESLGALASVPNKFMKVPPYTIIRFQVDVAQAGEVELDFGDAEHLQIWLDGAPVEPAARVKWTPAAGRRTVTLVVDREKRTAPLRCEVRDIAGSPAQVQIVAVK